MKFSESSEKSIKYPVLLVFNATALRVLDQCLDLFSHGLKNILAFDVTAPCSKL